MVTVVNDETGSHDSSHAIAQYVWKLEEIVLYFSRLLNARAS